jgi:hypothetical protein
MADISTPDKGEVYENQLNPDTALVIPGFGLN